MEGRAGGGTPSWPTRRDLVPEAPEAREEDAAGQKDQQKSRKGLGTKRGLEAELSPREPGRGQPQEGDGVGRHPGPPPSLPSVRWAVNSLKQFPSSQRLY